MPNAIHKMPARRPRRPKTNEFDYDAVKGVIADEMRSAAVRVRGFMRDSIVMVGLELLKVKSQVEHGRFQAWVQQECSLSIRTAERAMQAAELVGKNDKLSYLPADGLLALSSRAAKPMADEIIKRIEAGERLSSAEIKHVITAAPKGENATSRSKGPLDQIQEAITKLNDGRLRRFAEWFDRYRETRRAGASPEPAPALTDRPTLALPAPARSPPVDQAEPLGSVIRTQNRCDAGGDGRQPSPTAELW